MSKKNISVAPYYDTSSEETLKNYCRLLAVPGRVAQAREITVLQGLLYNALKSVGDALMNNGDIIEGCQIIVANDKKSVTVTEGKVYMEGMVMPLKTSTVNITGSGSEIIGVRITESIITDSIDSTLKDPAQGYDNFGQSGCDRLKRELEVVVNDNDASPLAHLLDGDVTVENFAPSYDTLTQTLARRTYDESGSYIVEGLKVRSEELNTEYYNLVVEAGKAYVLGYELKIPTARRIKIPKAKTTSAVTANNYLFKTTQLSYLLDGDPYVQSINYVRGRVSITEQLINSTNTDSIVLEHTDVVSITEVKQGDNTFTVGSGPSDGDCYLLRDGTRYFIKWNGNTAPTNGVSYNCTYQYNKNFTPITDYELDVSTSGSYLTFTSSGEKPLNDTNFTVDYNQYLARKDIVYIDQYGTISVEMGAPDEYGFEVAPSVPVNTLAIAQVSNPPNGSPNSNVIALNIQVDNVGLTRFTMNDIQSILNRVKKTEYNQSVLSLNDDARNRTTINSKKGILTDPLVDFSRIDMYYNIDNEGNPIDSEKSVYNMAIDLDNGIAYLPLNVESHNITGNSDSIKKYNRLATLSSKGENVVLEQPNATKSFLINPYSVFPQLPEVTINPAVDSWVEDNYVQVPVSLTNSTIIKTNTSILYQTARRLVGGSRSWTTVTSSSKFKDNQVGSKTDVTTTESVISEEAITYMRQIEITIEGSNYPPMLDNVKCSFDGVPVNLTPLEDTESGTDSGTVKTDSEGYLKAKFIVPANIRTGVREVKLWSDIKVDGYKSEGYTLYQSTGISRTIQQTITTVTTVLLQREITTTVLTTSYVDPIGQTFVLDKLSILKGIDVYFEAKPTTNEEVVLEIRNVVNGTIGNTVYTRTSLKSSQVNISNNASSPTRFNFSDPILLDKDTEYAFVIRSLSDKYRIWVSEIGGTDVKTKDLVLKNSYLTGVMMSSSNNSTWTAHQTTDIKFRLIEDVYESSGSITFDSITVDNISRLDLSAEAVVLNGTTLKWSYSIDGGTTFYSITPGVLRELLETASSVILKVNFNRTSPENITPILALDSILLIGSSYKLKGTYVGVTVAGVDAYTNIDVIMNTYIPAGTSLKVYVSTDGGNTKTECIKDSTQTKQLDNGWQELVYKATVSSATSCKIFIEGASTLAYSTPKFSGLKIIMS